MTETAPRGHSTTFLPSTPHFISSCGTPLSPVPRAVEPANVSGAIWQSQDSEEFTYYFRGTGWIRGRINPLAYNTSSTALNCLPEKKIVLSWLGVRSSDPACAASLPELM